MAKAKNITQLHINEESFKSQAFFSRLGKAVISAADTDFGTAAAQILGTANDKTVERKAFDLIVEALGNACRNILIADEEAKKILDAISNLSSRAKSLNTDIAKKLIDLKLSIGHSFFAAPHKSQFIKEIKALYQIWLYEQIALTYAQSESLAALLPIKFLEELAFLWSKNTEEYTEIEEYFKNPFFKAIEENHKKAVYYADLQAHYAHPVFGSPEMTLSDIYIAPDFKVYKDYCPTELSEEKRDSDGFYTPNYKNGIHEYFKAWFKGEKPLDLNAEQSNFTILLGQPGQGKTSFCLRTIYDLISKDLLGENNLYFVRLRNISNVRDAINNPLDSIRKHIAKFDFNSDTPLSLNNLDQSILILDGLDELYMYQGLSNADINNLVKGLADEVFYRKNLKIVLTTRYNYLNLRDLNPNKYLIIKLAELTLNQQLEWLKKYKAIYPTCSLTANVINTIHTSKDPKYKSIKELINQPILLQMIARSDLDVTEGSNRAKIYQTLFDNIIIRKWAKDGQLEKYQNLTEKDLRSFLQTIALAVFQSEAEYLGREAFKSNDLLVKAKDDFLKKTKNQLPLDDALKDILVSFYFKNKQKDQSNNTDNVRHNDYAIEFLHKSLQEYLVAEKIWCFFKETFTNKDTNKEYFIDSWEDVLHAIHPITSPKLLTREVINYLIEIIHNNNEEDIKVELATRLDYFLPFLLKRDFIYTYNMNKDLYPLNQGLATFYTYWTVHSHLRNKNSIVEDVIDRFIFLINSLKGIEPNLNINLSGIHLSDKELRSINFDFLILKNAYLRNADLRNANLRNANLRNAILRNAILINTDLSQAILMYADLSQAILKEAILISADLRKVILINADLRNANLKEADLRNANLKEADLKEATLMYADLREAILRDADLGEVDLRNADLRDADLRNTDLRDAILISTDLSETDLRNADLSGAYLKNTNITFEQLLSTKSLKDCSGLDEILIEKLKAAEPSLFE